MIKTVRKAKKDTAGVQRLTDQIKAQRIKKTKMAKALKAARKAIENITALKKEKKAIKAAKAAKRVIKKQRKLNTASPSKK